MESKKEFLKFTRSKGMTSAFVEDYMSKIQSSYISPTIIEERPMNVASMDVFSRLMMDRIIFLGSPIDDYVSNVILAIRSPVALIVSSPVICQVPIFIFL